MPYLPDDGFLALINPAGPPSFEHRLNALTKAVGPHPLLQKLDWDSDSETEAQLSEYEGRPTRPASWRETGLREGGAGREREVDEMVKDAVVEGKTRSSRRTREAAASRSRSSPPPPASTAASASTSAVPPPRSPKTQKKDDGMEVDEPAPSPVAGSSKSTKPAPTTTSSRRETRSSRSAAAAPAMGVDLPTPPTATTRTAVKSEPTPSPVKPAPHTSSPIIELSSDDEEPTYRPSKRIRRDSNIRAASSAALLIAQKMNRLAPPALLPARSSRSSTTASKAKKPRISLEVEIEKLQKLSGAKLGEEFKTISDFIAHLEQFEPAAGTSSRKILSGTRICFVNTDHWRTSTSHAILPGNASPLATRNRFDLSLRTWMTVAAKNGAVLVPPEEFRPPPYDVSDSQPFDPEQAEKEGWTTHIVPFVPSAGRIRLPSYDQVLACLGPEAGGIRRDELGPFVKVVQFGWVSASVGAKGKALEFDYELPGDFRAEERAEREKEREDSREVEKRRKVEKEREKRRREERREREKEEAKSRRPGARVRQESQETDREEGMSADEEDGGRPGEVSPFGLDDYPEGEAPPPGYFDHPGSSASYSHSAQSSIPPRARQAPKPAASSDPIIDADQTTIRGARPSVSPTTTPKFSPQSNNKRLLDADEVDPQAFSLGDDLAREVALIEEMGGSLVDHMLDAEEKEDKEAAEKGGGIDWEDEYMILSAHPVEDNETEDEREEEEAVRRGEKKRRERFNPWARIPKDTKYACDDPSKGCTNGPNEQVAKVLGHLADLQEQGSFRQRSYRMAAGRLRNYPVQLKHIDKLTKLRGIGIKMAQKILEIQRTGTHRRFSHQTPQEAAHALFGNIYGIGKVLCVDLYNQGARSIDDLRADPEKYGLHWDQELGLKHYEDLITRIPRSEMDELFAIVKAEAYKVDPKIECYCMGSYRRGEESSGDIDIMVTRPPVPGEEGVGFAGKVWKRLEKIKFVTHTLTEPSEWTAGDAVIHGLCKLPRHGSKTRRIDILGVPWDERAAALIYFTGNDYFNRSLRLKARHLGYRLNQRGLYKNVARDKKGLKITEGVKIEGLNTEEQLLAMLKVKWRPPEERKP